MDVSRRRAGARSSSVVAGSVWESRMKLDEVRGGIKVFNGEEISEEGKTGEPKLKRSPIGNGKRRTWKSESFEGLDKNPIQIAGGKTEPQKNSDERFKVLSVSADGIKKSPIQVRKLKSEVSKETSVPDRSSIQTRRQRSETLKRAAEVGKEVGESGEGFERSPVKMSKAKSDTINTLESDQTVPSVNGFTDDTGDNSVQLRKAKSEQSQAIEESSRIIEGALAGNVKSAIEAEKTGSDENCKEFCVCEEKVIPSRTDNVDAVDESTKASVNVEDDVDDEVPERDEAEEEEEEEEIEIELEKKSFDIKEINVAEPKKVVNDLKKFHQISQKPMSIPLTVKQPPSIERHSRIYQNFSKPNSSKSSI